MAATSKPVRKALKKGHKKEEFGEKEKHSPTGKYKKIHKIASHLKSTGEKARRAEVYFGGKMHKLAEEKHEKRKKELKPKVPKTFKHFKESL